MRSTKVSTLYGTKRSSGHVYCIGERLPPARSPWAARQGDTYGSCPHARPPPLGGRDPSPIDPADSSRACARTQQAAYPKRVALGDKQRDAAIPTEETLLRLDHAASMQLTQRLGVPHEDVGIEPDRRLTSSESFVPMSPLPPITTMPYLLVRRMRGCVRSPQVTNRAKAGGRRRPADHLLRPPRYLLAAPCQGVDDDGQRHLQRLAHGRRLARQVTRRGTAAPGRQR